MLVVFFSNVTENTSRFVEKLDLPALRIPIKTSEAGLLEITEKFVLITPTYGAGSRGFVPRQVIQFLNVEAIRNQCVGVVGSGNRNFFEDYAKAADIIAAKLGVPVLYRFELSGTDEDVNIVREGMNTLCQEEFA
jgi:protein involved in ribonucleotide reduction